MDKHTRTYTTTPSERAKVILVTNQFFFSWSARHTFIFSIEWANVSRHIASIIPFKASLSHFSFSRLRSILTHKYSMLHINLLLCFLLNNPFESGEKEKQTRDVFSDATNFPYLKLKKKQFCFRLNALNHFDEEHKQLTKTEICTFCFYFLLRLSMFSYRFLSLSHPFFDTHTVQFKQRNVRKITKLSANINKPPFACAI